MSKRKGFTLIELLVVISIIALLVSILMPALNRARQQATAAVCLGNQKAMIAAWMLYSNDNGDRLVGGMASSYNATGTTWYRGGNFDPAGKYGWICAPAIQTGNGTLPTDYTTATNNDNDTYLNSQYAQDYRKLGIELGKLWKYTKVHDVFHCPGDKNYKLNTPKDSFVSYAVTGTMNGEDIQVNNGNTGWNGLKAYTNSSQIKSPSEKMVFVEESTQGQSWLLGSFMVRTNTADLYNLSTWWDYMAVWHNKRGTLSFADGHAEVTQWESQATLDLAELNYRIGFSPTDQYCQDNMDLKRIVRWYGGRK